MTSYLDKPWTKSYKLGPYPLEHSIQPTLDHPIASLLELAAQQHPTQTALLFEDYSLSYNQLHERVDRLANGLISLGLGLGDRVQLFLPNCIEFALCYWAIVKAGGAVVPTSILRTEEGLLHEANTSSSRFVVCTQADLEKALGLLKKSEIEKIILVAFRGQTQKMSLPDTVVLLDDLYAYETTEPLPAIKPLNDLCELAFTGGATGVPKGVMITHANRIASTAQGLPWLMKPMISGIAGKASVLLSVPMFHAYGIYILTSAVRLGLRVIILPDPRDIDHIVETIREHRPFLIPGVPTQFMRMAEVGLKRINALLLSGSAPLPAEVAQRIQGKTGMPISEGYGLTETSTITHLNVSGFSKITGFMTSDKPGIGVPCPDTECRLIDPDTGEDVPFGEPGEVLTRGPQVMRGYWPEPGSGLAEHGWLHTGDIGIMDEDGYFQIVDRIKDMINVSGLKVYTTEVDEVLFKHPAVEIAAAFGIPDVEVPGSERVMAVVQLKPSQQDSVDEQDLRQFCRENLPPYAVPSIIEFQQELPLTVSEKVFKKLLREEAIERLSQENRWSIHL